MSISGAIHAHQWPLQEAINQASPFPEGEREGPANAYKRPQNLSSASRASQRHSLHPEFDNIRHIKSDRTFYMEWFEL